jgi:tRNA(Ile)-lysidine synthase
VGGDESDSDEALVRDWAESMGIRLHAVRFDTVSYAKSHSVSIEIAARELRYAFFDKTAREEGYDAVAVAHNANDNGETMVLNLLRGTGVRGLRGMDMVGTLPVEGSKIKLVRPLLDVPRSEISGYASANGIPFHEDRTNAENEANRNKIRNLVFPVFSKINPSFLKTFGKESEYFKDACDIMDEFYEDRISWIRLQGGEGISELDCGRLASEPHKEYIIHRFIEPYGFTEEVGRSIISALPDVAGKIWHSAGYRIYGTSRGTLVLDKAASPSDRSVREGGKCIVVEGPGDYELAGRRFRISVIPAPRDLKVPEGQLIADIDALPFPFLLRTYMPGDWLCPLGMNGKKKVSDLFTDLKFTLRDKERTVCAVVPGWNSADEKSQRVAAVLCIRIDGRLKVGPSPENVVSICEIGK